MSRRGLDVLGAGDDTALVVRLRNLSELVKKQGGAAGAAAYQLIPQTVTAKAYGTMRDKMLEGFRAQGVDADVKIVSAGAPDGAPPKSELLTGVVVGAGGVGVLYGIYKLIAHFVRRK